jgi:hypothetical protein
MDDADRLIAPGALRDVALHLDPSWETNQHVRTSQS